MRSNQITRIIAAPSCALLSLALVAAAGCKSEPRADAEDQAATPEAGEPATKVEAKPNGAWIKLSGKVVATGPDAFALDYGPGVVTAEFDDWDWFPEGEQMLVNDDVIVYGFIDDDLFESRKIEVSSVWVKDLGTQFYANGTDEEDFPVVVNAATHPHVEMLGRVKDVDTLDFQLDTGSGVINVDTSAMPYNPLDDEGYQKLEPGDHVMVTGVLDEDLFSSMDLQASTITTVQSAES